MKLKEKLNLLVQNKTILFYSIKNIDDEGKEGISKFRNSQRLTITFPNNETLEINTFCTGSSEDTIFT